MYIKPEYSIRLRPNPKEQEKWPLVDTRKVGPSSKRGRYHLSPETAGDRTSPEISRSESGCKRRVEHLSPKDPSSGIHCAAQKLEASGGARHRRGRNFNDDFELLSVW